MTTTNSTRAQIADLVTSAHNLIEQGAIVEATKLLQEASHLDASQPEVQAAWNKLRQADANSDKTLIDALDQCLADPGNEEKQRRWESSSRENSLSRESTDQCLDRILQAHDVRHANLLLKDLVSKQHEVRKSLAIRSGKTTDDFLSRLFVDENGIFAVSSVLLDDTIWTSPDEQRRAQSTSMHFAFKKLSSQDREEQALSLLVRLWTSASNKIRSADNASIELFLERLDIRRPQKQKLQALLIVVKILEATGGQGEQAFIRFVVDRIARGNDKLIAAMSAAAAVFPIIPTTSAKLFLTDGFVPQLVQILGQGRVLEPNAEGDLVESAALELFGAATVDKACRASILQHCRPWLQNVSEQRTGTISARATLVLAKLGESAGDDLTTKFSTMLLDDKLDTLAVEGLAYTSLRPAVKERIAKNDKMIKAILAACRDDNKLSALTILKNMTTYRPPRSEEQKKMAQLKAYANSSKLSADDPLDNDGMVTIRCKKLLDAGAVSTLTGIVKGTASITCLKLIAETLFSIAKEQKHRAKMAQEGAIGALILLHQRITNADKTASDTSTASHALARILISTNPAHVFSASVPVTSAVSAILPLLNQNQEQGDRNLLPTFEALLALTNLASMDDSIARELMIRQAWSTLEDQLLLCGNALVQRASVELVCNLMLSPSGVAKFADGGKQARTRMHILLGLADVEDLATRKAAGGALAMLTEWDTAVTAILGIERGIKILLAMCVDQSVEMRHRGMVCILNCISISGDVGNQAVAKVKAESGLEQIRTAVLTTKDANVLSTGAEILEKLT